MSLKLQIIKDQVLKSNIEVDSLSIKELTIIISEKFKCSEYFSKKVSNFIKLKNVTQFKTITVSRTSVKSYFNDIKNIENLFILRNIEYANEFKIGIIKENNYYDFIMIDGQSFSKKSFYRVINI